MAPSRAPPAGVLTRLAAAARVGRARLRSWRDPVCEAAPGLELGVAVLLLVLALALPRPPAVSPPPSPSLKAALSGAQLELLREALGPGGRRVVARLEAHGRMTDPDRPAGWALFDLKTLPTLGLGPLVGADARAVNAVIPLSRLPVEPGKPFRSADLGSPTGKRALQCLTQAIYFETGRDDERSQSAVAQVVLNRVRHPAYPNSVCGVVYQGALRATGCQFSFTCDGSLKRGVMTSAWNRAQAVARRALQGFVMSEVGVSTNYHADYVAPYWARTVVKIVQVGPHIFYRWTGPLGQRRALTQRYSGNETDIARDILASWDERTQGVDAAVALAENGGRRGSETETAVRVLQSVGLVAKVQDGRVHALLNPVARKPTPDEVRAINAKLADYEKGLEPAAPPGAAGP